MLMRSVVRAGLLALCLGAISCQKLPARGALAPEPAPFADAVPSAYGKLYGVSQRLPST